MRTQLGVLALAAALLGGIAAGAGPAAAATDPAGPDVASDVVVASASGARSTWFPTVERLRDGDLLVVYYDSTSHLGPDGRIAMTRSHDGGRTWSTPAVAVDTALDDRDPSIVELASGTLVMSWFETDWSTKPLPTPGGVWTARSTDGGRSWSAPVRARSQLFGNGSWTIPPVGYSTPWAATSAKILELPDGTLLLPVYGNTPDDASPSISVLRSRDGGRSWPAETLVARHAAGDKFNEPALTRLGDGSIQLAIRGTGVGYWTSSTDGGRTWAPATTVGAYREQASDLLTLPQGDRRTILHTWGDTSGVFGPGRPTVGQLITADGVRHPARLLYSGGAFDESYPSSVQLGPARFFTVYYDAARKIIGGTYTRFGDYL